MFAALYHCNKLRQSNPAVNELRRLGIPLLPLNEILDRNVALTRTLALDVVFLSSPWGSGEQSNPRGPRNGVGVLPPDPP